MVNTGVRISHRDRVNTELGLAIVRVLKRIKYFDLI